MTKNSTSSSSSLLLPAILVAAFVLLSWVFVSNSYAYALINLGSQIDYGTEASVNTSVDLNAEVKNDGTSPGTVDTSVNVESGSNEENDDGSTVEVFNINRTELGSNVESGAKVEARSVVTNGDLRAYALSAISADADLEAMNFSEDTVEIKYKEQGKLLALVPITFTARAIAHADGTIELKYPWYSVLTVDNKTELETKIQVAVDNALNARMVGSVQAEGEEASPAFTAPESAEVAAQIHAVLSARETVDGDY